MQHGFAYITPLPMPDAEEMVAVTIPKFTFEGYGATVASAWSPAPFSVYPGRGDPGYLLIVMQDVPSLGAVITPVRSVRGESEDWIRVNPRRQAAALFRGGYESVTDSAPLLVIETRPDDDAGKPEQPQIAVYLLQPSTTHISFFTEVRSWTTSGRYCYAGSALNRVVGIAPRVHETVDGCEPEK